MEKPPINQLDEPFSEVEEKLSAPRNKPMPQHELDEPFDLAKNGITEAVETPEVRRERLKKADLEMQRQQEEMRVRIDRARNSAVERQAEQRDQIRLKILKDIAWAVITGNVDDVPTYWDSYISNLPPDLVDTADDNRAYLQDSTERVIKATYANQWSRADVPTGPSPEEAKYFDEKIKDFLQNQKGRAQKVQ
ncbi:MAG: hypothetical protein WC766_06160 [Patescibacteria group bacterium]|jgi:hypothetical protein